MTSAVRRRAVAAVLAFLLVFAVTSPRSPHARVIEGAPISIARETGWEWGTAIASITVPTTVPPTTAPPPAPPTTTVRVRAASASTARVVPPPTTDLVQRANDALSSVVPAAWRDTVHPWFVLIEGYTSWSSTTGRIRIARFHASGPYERLRAIVAHEWGHQVAFRYGTKAYLGAPPAGWPYQGDRPAEAWGDCVAQTLTGLNPSRRVGECDDAALQFIRDWLARGPGG